MRSFIASMRVYSNSDQPEISLLRLISYTFMNVLNSQIHRHGDRNINSRYPKDPYNSDRHWPGGLGALTEVSKWIFTSF